MDYQLGPGPLQVDQNTLDEKIKGDIGIVENGDVATHAIPSGYYVIWKGNLYVAKTDISSGTTLSAASNGNLTAKPNGLGAEVAALNSKLIVQGIDQMLYTKVFTFNNNLSKSSGSTTVDVAVSGKHAIAAIASSNWYEGAITQCTVYDFTKVALAWENHITTQATNLGRLIVFYTNA